MQAQFPETAREEKPELPAVWDWGSGHWLRSPLPPASHPQIQETLAAPGALSHTDFLLPPAGAEAFLWPLDLGLGLGRKKEGRCEECPPTGKTGWGVGEGNEGTLTVDDRIFYIIHYTQGPYEGDMLISI